MTAPKVWTVTDPDGGWEVYIGNASGGYRVVSHQGGTAVVHTLPDGAVRMVARPTPRDEYRVASSLGSGYMIPQPFANLDEAGEFLRRHNEALEGLPGVDTVRIEYRPPAGMWTPLVKGGDRRG